MQVLRSDAIEAESTRLFEPREPLAPVVDTPYAMVVVEWQDAWFDQDQVDGEEFRSEYLVRTMGFLIDEGPHVISVAHEVLPEGDGFRAVTHIPVPIIRRIHRLSPCDGSTG